ncbi:Ppx/GppA phosphatase family protein [Rickettsia endosymbiont of Cardiosporidium cionae]|uniref:Ppx/GppA phosphatase family protein n=1 Tax=Rickettsia endosymbiont of Cardiosporidium cionae TaxID=2777155 RepID=UPI001893CB26|nr:hypothetical protein [Rickettsia endosymbiont of Cardiosporidium cionae]KAF8818573.1 Ppx/GppA family phosphatase [Rickettsia endosymbiont of Cardiosporidium cionae]
MRSGIIEIGSNAIRFSCFNDNTVGAYEILTKTFMVDIRNLLANQQFVYSDKYFEYIVYILYNLRIMKIKCIATAALRGHESSQSFIHYIKNKFNLVIEVISGEQEGYLSAKGLLNNICYSSGMAVDFGGGSLELIEIINNQVNKVVSLELGSKIKKCPYEFLSVLKIKQIIANNIQCSGVIENIFFIGGSLRFIGKLFVRMTNYPIKNVHHIEIPADRLMLFIDQIKLSNLFSKEQNLNQNACMLVKALIDLFVPKMIIVSSYGLKEGLRLELMESKEKAKNPIQEQLLGYQVSENAVDFDKYHQVIADVLPEISGLDIKNIVTYAIIVLSKYRHINVNFVPNMLVDYILQTSISFTHKIRVILSLIMFYAHNFSPSYHLKQIAKTVINRQEFSTSIIIGNMLYISKEIDGYQFTSPSFGVSINNHHINIIARTDLPSIPSILFNAISNNLKYIENARKKILFDGIYHD